MDELYSSLGYGKSESPERFKALNGDIHAYFSAYEREVNIIGSSLHLTDRALLCAANYLTEESRGQKFWPDDGRGAPIWPTDEQFITNTIGHILSRKGKGSDVGRCKARTRARQSESGSQTKRPAKSGKKRRREESDDDFPGGAERLEGLTKTVKPWHQPPRGPSRRAYGQYIESLNPRRDVKRLAEFTTAWLTGNKSQWPEIADVKLQTFMHNRKFYVLCDYGEDPPSDLIDILRKGSEIETLENGLLYVEFQHRIRDRVEFLTHQLTRPPHVVLEVGADGNVHMVTGFAASWARREEYWDSASVDIDIDIATAQAASLAAKAKQKRENPRGPKKRASPQGEMFVSDATATSFPERSHGSRSIWPENSIVVDTATPSASPSPEGSSLRLIPQKAARDGMNGHVSSSAGCQLSTPPPSMPSIDNTPTSKRPRQCRVEIPDVRTADEDFRQYQVVDGSGNIKFLKIEPGPVVADHQSSLQSESCPSLLHTGDQRCPTDAPVSSNSVRSEAASSTEPATRHSRSSASPASPSETSPRSPSRAFDKFLSHYGNRSTEPELPSPKEIQLADPNLPIMSPKERLRAKKRAEVLAEAAEWEEIRHRESRSQTGSPPKTSTAPKARGGDMQPPVIPARVSARNNVMQSTPLTSNPSTNTIMGSSDNSNQGDQNTTPAVGRRTRTSTSMEKPQAPVLSGPATHAYTKTSLGVLSSQNGVCSSPLATARRPGSQIPRLVPNLTKPLSPMVSNIRTPTPGPASDPSDDRSSYTAPAIPRAEKTTPALLLPRQNTAPLTASLVSPSPSIARILHNKEASESTTTPNVALQIISPVSGSRDHPPSDNTAILLSPSLAHTPTPVNAGSLPVQTELKQPRTFSASTLPSVTPSPTVRSMVLDANSTSDNFEHHIDMAAATAETLVANTAEGLQNGGSGEPPLDDMLDKDSASMENSRSTTEDLPPRRHGAYANVPQSVPFSATPSEEEMAAFQALQFPGGNESPVRRRIKEEPSLVKSTFQGSETKTLELLIESANGEMNLETGFSFDVVMNNSLSGFFSFYAAVSEAPIESFQHLVFTPTWPNCPNARATKQMGETAWKKLKKVIQAWYKQAQRAEPEETDFQIMVQMG